MSYDYNDDDPDEYELNVPHHPYECASLSAICYESVREVDRHLREGYFLNEEAYQVSLARIRDYGIMHGLTARIIHKVFCMAHSH